MTEHAMAPPPPKGPIERDQAGLLRITEAAQQTGVAVLTIRYWIRVGKLPSVRIAGRRYIHPHDLAAIQASVHLGEVVPAWQQDRRHAGRRLRQLREAAGLTQLELAAASGLTHEAISNLETGKRAPRAETVRALAHALGVEPERFVSSDPLGLRMLTVADAASWLDVPAGRVQTWLKQGHLAGEKVSGQWRVPAIVVAELERSERLRGRSRRLDPRYRG